MERGRLNVGGKQENKHDNISRGDRQGKGCKQERKPEENLYPRDPRLTEESVNNDMGFTSDPR